MTPLPLRKRILAAFTWISAFALACGVYFSLTLLLQYLPPTPAVAIGLVTIERYSKLRDYAGAALFLLLVPGLTIPLQRWFARRAAFSFLLPYLLSPLFYLTTGKIGWILLLPIALSFAVPKAIEIWRTRLWIRELASLGPYHALLFAEAASWLFYRSIVTGRRIAHIDTLFLEIVFVAMFFAIFWAAAILIARVAQLSFGGSHAVIFRRVVIAALPIVVLPFLAAIWVPYPQARATMALTLAVIAVLALRLRRTPRPETVWKLAALLLIPALVYLFSFVSTAQLSAWIDLFHRGESIGPASDYLEGKVPFRDVFVLHGMLEDGQLDAWLMEIFGRSLEVAVMRPVVIGAFLGVAIWYLGLALFDSIPLALLCVAVGSWTTAENDRTFFQVGAVALFWNALRRRSGWSAVWSGVFAGVALFFSYEIGLYTIVGAFATCVLLWFIARRTPWNGLAPARAAVLFSSGVAIGGAPFALYLAAHGAFRAFLSTSFVEIPRIIDAVWSLPFPDLVSTFRKDLNLHTLADFVLWEKFHLIVSPLTIAIAAVYFIQRWLRRNVEDFDFALFVLTAFAAVAQRTAFGRVSFRHQYFAAFLIGPLLVMLGVLGARKLRDLWRQGGDGAPAFVTLLVAVLLPAAGVLFWIPDLINARLQDFVRYPYRMARVERDAHAEEVGWRITDVSKEIQALTRPGEPIFDFSNQPAFYFFANRPNPTRFYQVPILSPREFQAEAIRSLDNAKPKVILRRSPELFDQFDGVTNELRAQALAAYLDDTYHFFKSVRGVELWTRRIDAKPRPLESYLGAIRIPSEKELVESGRARMVFPAVGSVPGVGGAYWRSDLTVHNPFREPISIALRYVTERGGSDRRFTLAPRQTLRWPDVVRLLFASEGVGTLWIEHRASRAPVAIVKTADVAHNGRASLEQPLTSRDAATAQSDTPELAIVGVPASQEAVRTRRVNVGVVNTGTIPATFRVTVRTRTGQLVGQSVESGVPEDEVWLVNDVEGKLGVQLDESMTVRISAIAGSGVGFATVVTSDGDSEFITAIPAQQ